MQNDPIPLRASTSRETVRHKRQHFSIWGLNLQRENEEYMHGACLGCLCCLRQLARGGACPQSAATEPARLAHPTVTCEVTVLCECSRRSARDD
jgi:hypothetical protein